MVSCPSCGAEVPGGFAFCGRCGAALASGAGVEERRVVTVLFCDLAGFTARSDQAGTGWRGLGVVLEHAQALLGLGRCATRLGHRSARDPLDEAAELFGQLRAPGLLAETGHWRLQAAGS